ncbi:MAG TPA: Gfo/Idh/MocA family oxidoreductase [Thermoanaerobaculia bacterium]|nr:Gfo/Idh/MocA family oxidoreductase [Thermoanaerobaculia bacterium]
MNDQRSTMRVGIIGTGWGARVQVPAFRAAGLDVAAIAGRAPEKTRGTAARLGVVPFDSGEALIERAAIDLVSIVSPPATHLPYAARALERGLHVLCEKPTALNASEAREMVARAAAHPDRLALIDHELRFLPAWREAKQALERIGTIRYAEVRYSSPSRHDPKRAWSWWSDAEQHGGIWGAVGSHYVDAIRYLVGEIEQVQAVLQTFVTTRPSGEGPRPVTSDDFAAVHLRIAGGATAAMTFSVVAAVDEPTSLTLVGDTGAYRLVRDRLLFAPPGGEWTEVVASAGAGAEGDTAGGAFGTATIHLARALRAWSEGDRDALAPAATFADGLRQQQVLDAARRSHSNNGAWELV